LNSAAFVYFTQLFYKFQHSNPEIFLVVNLTSTRLRPEQSAFITCF